MSRRNTPPIGKIKEQLTVLGSLSKWADIDDEGDAQSKKDYKELRGNGDGDDETTPAPPPWWKKWLDVESDNFNFIIGGVIVLNAIAIGFQTDLGNDGLEAPSDYVFLVLECVFNLFFLIEMIVRLAQLGREYFKDPWNWFDFTLVLIGCVQMFVLTPYKLAHDAQHKSGNYTQLRLLRMVRILRLLRVLRVIRLFRMFHQLFLILTAFGKAFQVVGLIGVLVFIVDYVLAIVVTSNIGKHAEDWGADAGDVEYWFGSIGNSMSTLFGIMTLSNWYEIAQVLAKIYPRGLIFSCFVFYIMVTSYTMISLITGIIAESLITSQQEYKYNKLASIEKQRKAVCSELKELFTGVLEDDQDDAGNVDAEELKKSLSYERGLTGRLASLGIAVDDDDIVNLIDKMASDSQGVVNIDYFVDKLTHINGAVNATQVVDLKREITKVQYDLGKLAKKFDEFLEEQKKKDSK
jgi:voltage-gated sodium channel